VKIPKKGDYRNCKNWRGITLLVVTSKVFTRIILDRISGILETGIRKEQAGFRPNRSCADQINTLRIIIEQSLYFQSPLHLLFVDYQKAFDSVDRIWIWKALKERGLPNTFIKLIQEVYNQFSCRVLHNGHLTTPFETKSGVRQGCLLSPLLFLVVLDKVLRASLDGKARVIRWKLTETLEDLDYAGDICLLSHSQAYMQSKLDNLCYESKKAGLEINFCKTEELRVNTISQRSIMLANKAIRRVHDFTYLGNNVSEDGGTRKNVETRTQKARGAFTRLRKIWVTHYVHKDTVTYS
jgi:hypothetical protein